jgi:hypothetical protein
MDTATADNVATPVLLAHMDTLVPHAAMYQLLADMGQHRAATTAVEAQEWPLAAACAAVVVAECAVAAAEQAARRACLHPTVHSHSSRDEWE